LTILRGRSAFGDLIAEARSGGVALWRTPSGFSFAPARNGDVMPPEKFEQLPLADRERIGRAIEALQQRLERLMRQVVGWRRERRAALRQLNREATIIAVGNLVDDLIRQYLPLPEVVGHLVALQRDVIENAELFQQPGEGSGNDWAAIQSDGATPTRRYQLNVLMQPFAWDALKRALITRELRIESVGQQIGLSSTVTLEPQPMPFDAKVVLFGERSLYMLLRSFDPDFSELFKIAPEFGRVTERTAESVSHYAQWLALAAKQAGLRPFGTIALARVIDWSSRIAEDATKLSLELRRVRDLLVAADQWAGRRGAECVQSADVLTSLASRRVRTGDIRQRVHQQIFERTLLIDTEGSRVAQANGLAVIALGEHSFGLPARITATTRIGDGSVVDIQRESQLGGSVHTKGVMILSSYLAARYSAREPLSLSGSLVFEQTYAEVDGDSASLAELCALLSSLSGLALRQSSAITGSVNQHGEVQAIGAVNEKIEGFFDVCEARRTAADAEGSVAALHGVLIPASNIRHLALRDEVIAAVQAGHFAVVAVQRADEAIAWLISEGGEPPDVTACSARMDERIRRRLREFARLRQRFAGVSAAERVRRQR